jgi:hypothetical protein
MRTSPVCELRLFRPKLDKKDFSLGLWIATKGIDTSPRPDGPVKAQER